MSPQENLAFTTERLRLAVEALVEVAVSRGMPDKEARQIIVQAAQREPSVVRVTPEEQKEKQRVDKIYKTASEQISKSMSDRHEQFIRKMFGL